MSDEIDQTNDRAEIENDRQIAAIRAAAAEIPEGSGASASVVRKILPDWCLVIALAVETHLI